MQSYHRLCIMMHSMIKKVYFYLEERWHKACLPEAAEAVRNYRRYGFETDLWILGAEDDPAQLWAPARGDDPSRLSQPAEGDDPAQLPQPDCDALCIADSERLLEALSGAGAALCGYSHGGNLSENLAAADYVLMEPQWVDRDSLVKIWQRQRHLPWTILQTPRCVVREFVPEDLEAIAALYDEEALRYLEPPSEDTQKERKILAAYIDRVYRLCGYGHWAVLRKETGGLIGRIGFSFPKADAPGSAADASFGYLLRSDVRGQGIAREVCGSLLDYGFSQLGFEKIGADADFRNIASAKILRSFGFREVARREDQRYYILNKNDWSYIL